MAGRRVVYRGERIRDTHAQHGNRMNKNEKIQVKVPLKKGRLDAKPVIRFRNKKKYVRKAKYPQKYD